MIIRFSLLKGNADIDEIVLDIHENQNDEPDQESSSRSRGLDDLLRFFSDA